MKKKGTTALLALLFGIFGVHRFYLGERVKGFLYLFMFGVSMVATIEEDAPFIMFPAILGFIDAVLFFVKPKEEFDEKYNKKYLGGEYEARPSIRQRIRTAERGLIDDVLNIVKPKDREYEGARPKRRQGSRSTERRIEVETINTFKESGMRKYDDYDILGAITDFRKALNSNFKDQQVHYLIACCYSVNEEPERALFHLDKAVDFGFIDFDTIHSVDALAYLRTHKRFEEFVANSYQIPRYLPVDEEAQLNQMDDPKANDLLDQIAALGKLYEEGVLTPDEFQQQKQKLFST